MSSVPQDALDHARAVADALLYEGYLLYPYRSTSSKNQVRWQFGVVGPDGAAEAGIGEESSMSADCLVRAAADARLTVRARFLHLQRRTVEAATGDTFAPVDRLDVDGRQWLPWDEAVEAEVAFESGAVPAPDSSCQLDVDVPAATEVEAVLASDGSVSGRLVRTRAALTGSLTVAGSLTDVAGLSVLSASFHNEAPRQSDKDSAIAVSFIGAHLMLEVENGEFVSIVDPPDDAADAARACTQHRWWPVLAGPEDESRLLLVSPIIVQDHAELAPQSKGALFDSTEIDEILTLRIMTLTDQEKAEARATDPRAAEIIDRCDAMTPEELQQLHGVLRNAHGADPASPVLSAPGNDPYALPDQYVWDSAPDDDAVFKTETPWWDPEADASVSPSSDTVAIAGTVVGRGSMVTVHPNRRADAHDMFFVGMTAKVAAVLSDVDGDTHVAVTLIDDPAAEMHDWYGRYLYFAPDELRPLVGGLDALQPTQGDHA